MGVGRALHPRKGTSLFSSMAEMTGKAVGIKWVVQSPCGAQQGACATPFWVLGGVTDVLLKASVGLVGFPVLGKLFVMGLAVGALTWGTFASWLMIPSLWKRSNCWKEEGSQEQTG